jgi:hypothetical protein
VLTQKFINGKISIEEVRTNLAKVQRIVDACPPFPLVGGYEARQKPKTQKLKNRRAAPVLTH